MSKLDVQYDIINETPASASPVDANYKRIEQHTNQELIERDGTVAMRAQLKLVGDPVADLDAAPKQYVDQVLPIGIIMMFGGAGVPPGGRWAVCNGAELEAALYPALFNVIGTNFSPGGTPAGRFNLPNLTDRIPLGAGTIAALGATGGNKDAIVPAHVHNMSHDHPPSSTGWDDREHFHLGADHLHPVAINTGYEDSSHDHWLRGAGDTSSAGGFGEGNVADKDNTGFNGAFRTLGANSSHYHAVNGNTGAADRSLWSGPNSTYHVHGTVTPGYSGNTSENAGGVSPTNGNLPPYVGVAYVMRVS